MTCKAAAKQPAEHIGCPHRFPQFPEDPQNAAEHMFESWNMWRSPSLLEAQAVLDGRGRGVYVSEYATWDTKITTWPRGNLKVELLSLAMLDSGLLSALSAVLQEEDVLQQCCKFQLPERPQLPRRVQSPTPPSRSAWNECRRL